MTSSQSRDRRISAYEELPTIKQKEVTNHQAKGNYENYGKHKQTEITDFLPKVFWSPCPTFEERVPVVFVPVPQNLVRVSQLVVILHKPVVMLSQIVKLLLHCRECPLKPFVEFLRILFNTLF